MEHFKETSESIKEECFSGAFNTEDILTAPVCELNDPITIGNVPKFQNSSGLTTPKVLEEIMTPVTAFEPIKEELLTDEIVESYTTDFVDVDQTLLLDTEDSFSYEKPSTSFDLKIADFAIDPDSCVVLSTPMVNQSSRATNQKERIEDIRIQPKENTELAPTVTDHLKHTGQFQLKRLSFIHASKQYDKLYQVNFQPNALQSKEYYILTSGPEQNNTKTEWKLFLPANSEPMSAEFLVNMDVKYDKESGYLAFKLFKFYSLKIRYIEHLPSFILGISMGQAMMVQGKNINKIVYEFEAQNGNKLIPTFHYKKEVPHLMFQTELGTRLLGYEGVPINPIKEERLGIIKMIYKNLEKHYPADIMPRVNDMAMLMERDINEQNLSKPKMYSQLFFMKSCFISKIEKYPNLIIYPDILYQILRKSLLSLNTTENLIHNPTETVTRTDSEDSINMLQTTEQAVTSTEM